MGICETVKIKCETSGYRIINKDDFDKKEHKLATDEEIKKADAAHAKAAKAAKKAEEEAE